MVDDSIGNVSSCRTEMECSERGMCQQPIPGQRIYINKSPSPKSPRTILVWHNFRSRATPWPQTLPTNNLLNRAVFSFQSGWYDQTQRCRCTLDGTCGYFSLLYERIKLLVFTKNATCSSLPLPQPFPLTTRCSNSLRIA